MAIIPTSSNSTNISNLPKAQLAVGTDLLILQTTNGTQVITFDNLNVVRTDINGNATVTGDLTGNNAIFNGINCTSLTAANIQTAFGPGATLAAGSYNYFQIQNGLVLSAASVITTDPVYQQIVSVDIPTALNTSLSGYRRVADYSAKTSIAAGTSAVSVVIGSFFSQYPFIISTQLAPTNFSLAMDTSNTVGNAYPTILGNVLSGSSQLTPYTIQQPIIPYITTNSIYQPSNTYDLVFEINVGAIMTDTQTVYYRLNVTAIA